MSDFPSDMKLIDEDVVRHVAAIAGPSSAAQRALDNAADMLGRGVRPTFGLSEKHACWIVFDAEGAKQK